MNNKHIRIMTILGLIAIVTLQGVWLGSTYALIDKQVRDTSENVFKDAVISEAWMQMEKITKGESTDTTSTVNETVKLEADSTQTLTNIMRSSIGRTFQESLFTNYATLPTAIGLDTTYVNLLHDENIYAEVVCYLTDSLGNVLESSRDIDISGLSTIKTSLSPVGYTTGKCLQAVIVNPYAIIFQRMTMLLVATALMMMFVAYCIVFQIRIIARQNKIARLREDFSYAMIHDMKTPLTSILMGVQILRSGRLDALPEKREKYFQILKDEAEHLLALTNKVLTLSKLENHQLKLAQEEVELRPMLDDLIEKYSAKVSKPVRFLLQLDRETVYADEEFLKEAVSNLIDNSIKYSGDSVEIHISSMQRADGTYIIKVKDNGFGIPLKDQSRIFEKYERASAADHSRKTGVSGFGLGLNYVFRVAEAHGGEVSVESIEGEYSEFSLCLPGKEKEK